MNLNVINDNLYWCHRCENESGGNCSVSKRGIAEHARETSCPIDRFGSILVRSTDPAEKVVAAMRKPLYQGENWQEWSNVQEGYRRALQSFASDIPSAKAATGTTGIVIAAGGAYFDSAYVSIRIIRDILKCELPIEMWYLGPDELQPWMTEALEGLNVTTIDAIQLALKKKTRQAPTGYKIKSFALMHTTLQHVLFLDADSYPLFNPTELFEIDRYKSKGVVFFKDQKRFDIPRRAYEIFGTRYRGEEGFENGQLLIDTVRCNRELQLWRWMDDRSEYYHAQKGENEWVGLGDCFTAHMAWRYFRDSEFAYASGDRWRAEFPAVIQKVGSTDWFCHRINGKLSLNDDQKENELFGTTSQAPIERRYNADLPLEAEAWGYLYELRAFAPVESEDDEDNGGDVENPVALYPEFLQPMQPGMPPFPFYPHTMHVPAPAKPECSSCKRKKPS